MAGIDRREFLATLGCAGLAGVTGAEASDHAPVARENARGVLVDLTQCIGCRKCEWACNSVNGLPTQALETFEDKSVFAETRRPDAAHYTVVNESTAEGRPPQWAKIQCMHCADPACASACLVSALRKQENGAVIYEASRCMGCRYCMVSCPFDIPTYEYGNALTPEVRKCTFCFDRLQEGGVPGCVEICPPQCLTFGKRSQLVELAHAKIQGHPDKYIDHVYGEHEAGGTSWLYVSDRPFEQAGLPPLPEYAPPRRTEALQHGIFKNFLPPLGLYGVLAMVALLFRRRPAEALASANPGPAGTLAPANPGPAAAAAHAHEEAAPVGKKLLTPGTMVMLALMAIGAVFAGIRFTAGLAATTNLTNAYPWGIWIAIDVATGVALAAGGFTTAALAHIFHQEDYHPIVRPALLTAVLGYTFVVLGLLADLGRYYNVWHPMLPSMWSGHSVLFEVGMCVMAYLTVLYLEFVPIVIERVKGNVRFPGPFHRFEPAVERFVAAAERSFKRVMLLLILAGVVLSCLHQSSLGSLMMLVPSKMSPLWYTPVLPLLFLLSAIAVGFPVVIFESMLASRAFGREPEMHLLSRLGRIVPVLLGIYLVVRVSDLMIRGVGGTLFEGGAPPIFFAAEILLGVVLPFVLFLMDRVRRSPRGVFLAATLVILGVVLNRVNVFIVAYQPYHATGRYFPSIGEVAVTVGLFAGLMFVYRVIVTHFPVLPAEAREE
jgi:Ni/Fe-hydrogenase subunit HybB-like protein/Fe-S-cluster-containing dehydrogenase component